MEDLVLFALIVILFLWRTHESGTKTLQYLPRLPFIAVHQVIRRGCRQDLIPLIFSSCNDTMTTYMGAEPLVWAPDYGLKLNVFWEIPLQYLFTRSAELVILSHKSDKSFNNCLCCDIHQQLWSQMMCIAMSIFCWP